jgi:hypothetical protein
MRARARRNPRGCWQSATPRGPAKREGSGDVDGVQSGVAREKASRGGVVAGLHVEMAKWAARPGPG